MADSIAPQTTGRVTRRSARLASLTPQVDCLGTGMGQKIHSATADASNMPRKALFDISNASLASPVVTPVKEVPAAAIDSPAAAIDSPATVEVEDFVAVPTPEAAGQQATAAASHEQATDFTFQAAQAEPQASPALDQSARTVSELAAEAQAVPSAPPVTPEVFGAEEEVELDYTPFEESVNAELEALVADDELAEAFESTPLAAVNTPSQMSEAGQSEPRTGGSRWAMDSPYENTTPGQWAAGVKEASEPEQMDAAVSVHSKVVADEYDPRSLRQLRNMIKEKASVKLPAEEEVQEVSVDATSIRRHAAAEDYEWEEGEDYEPENEWAEYEEEAECYEEAYHGEEEADDLIGMMGGMGLGEGTLRGMAAPQGQHIRFTEEGDAVISPSSGRVHLRGMPEPAGTHVRF